MYQLPNVMFIHSKYLSPEPDTGYRIGNIRSIRDMHFVFIQEKDSSFTVFKNSYDGVKHTNWTYAQCLGLLEVAIQFAKDVSNED